jgi:putative colanic acid biosysnthesis UDP-glucose lipid carrier transferase
LQDAIEKPILIDMRTQMLQSSFHYSENFDTAGHPELPAYWSDNYGFLIFKRIFDVMVSLFILLFIFSWLFPVVALLIMIDSRGPVFFKQKRVGFLGKIFSCYKFRTMYVNDAADTRRASKDDPRVTRIGHFLRNTCLDEVPQFINVLLGDMSIVGPRPHMIKDSREFSDLIANYSFRYIARPGITGLSQVRGYRGPAASVDSILRRYQWDAYYVRNASLALDTRIMAETCWLMVTSLIHKDKPIPVDNAVYDHAALAAAKKIA